MLAPCALVAAAVLSSCSLTAADTVSAASLETDIAGQLASSYRIPKPPVHCPRSVPAVAGHKFTCTATLDGQALKVKGTVTSSRGQVEVRPATAVVVTKAAEAELAGHLKTTFRRTVGLSCRLPALLVATPGRRFSCTVTVGTIKRQLAVTVTGTAGALSYRVLPYKHQK